MLKLADKFMLKAARKYYDLKGCAPPEQGGWLMRLEMRVTERESLDAALMLAVRQKNEGEVRRLAKLGADPNALCLNTQHQIKESAAAIHVAALLGEHRLLQVLLNYGGKADARDRDGLTPLMYVPQGSSAITETIIATLLISSGADVNARDDRGMTPLHHATCHSKEYICGCLLAHYADPRMKDNFQRQPLDLASLGSELHKMLDDADKWWRAMPPPPPPPELVFSVETAETVSISKPLRLKPKERLSP